MLYYYFILAFQGYCLYHAYKNKSNYYWFFILFFIPLVGCLVYVFTQVIHKRDIDSISKELTSIIHPTKKVKALEQTLAFSNTFQNRIDLADAYLENKDIENAILQYEKSLESNFKNEPHTLSKLVKCYFEVDNFDKVIEYATKLDLDKNFQEIAFFFGIALEKKGNIEKAEIQLRKMDKRFSNYKERIGLSNFLIRNNKKEAAKETLNEIISEISSMSRQNLKKHSSLFLEAESTKSLL